MKSSEIRLKFLEFFKGKGHKIVESDSLVPLKDPTILFTGAGMNQFKDEFLGRNIKFRRAATCQKCLRTGDLEKVGKTPGHHTFFEMLGNFSFGDYFKKEAIAWAWEFMTKELRIPEARLWASVYEKDDEAYKIWEKDIRVPLQKIARLGAEDNFWPQNAPEQGPNGPCGPCSEIFYDWGIDAGCGKKGCGPACDCGRFVEVWNLVFTQYNRTGRNVLEDLPSKNIDTGMGLERISAVTQAVKTNFETDLFLPILDGIKHELHRLSRDRGLPDAAALNAIADHVRAAAFAIADGVAPSNEERGYVVRKLIRKAYLVSGADKPFLYNIVPAICRLMGGVYPDVLEKREEIALAVKEEEEKFQNTLENSSSILDEVMKNSRGKIIKGDDIFKLVDTYGLPIEVIEKEASSKGLGLDMKGFDSLMEEQRKASRTGSRITTAIFDETVIDKAPIPALSDKETPLKIKIAFVASGNKIVSMLKEGDEAEVITEPASGAFYAEQGGQVGDSGEIKAGGNIFIIENTYKIRERIVHFGRQQKGTFKTGDAAAITLDEARKEAIAKNHTATHLLQSALREVLGRHVQQSGSLVSHDRLRFDFTHMKKLTERELARIEELVNERIDAKDDVRKDIKPLGEAKKEGAIALFGEKYGESVTVLSIGDYSKELCGGTHVGNTKEIGIFKIISESSIASGIRRIEALTGGAVLKWLEDDVKSVIGCAEKEILSAKKIRSGLGIKNASIVEQKIETVIAPLRKIKSSKEYVFIWSNIEKPELVSLVEKLREEEGSLRKEMERGGASSFTKEADSILSKARDVKGVAIVSAELTKDMLMGLDIKRALDIIMDKANAKNKPLIAVIGVKSDGKALIAGASTKDVPRDKVNLGDILKEAGAIVGGSGGGRQDFGTAGGRDASRLELALQKAARLVEARLVG